MYGPPCDSTSPVIREECFLLDVRDQNIEKSSIFEGARTTSQLWNQGDEDRVFGLCSAVRQKSFGDYGAQKSCWCARTCLWTLQWDRQTLLCHFIFTFAEKILTNLHLLIKSGSLERENILNKAKVASQWSHDTDLPWAAHPNR